MGNRLEGKVAVVPRIRDIMVSDVVTISRSASVVEAAQMR